MGRGLKIYFLVYLYNGIFLVVKMSELEFNVLKWLNYGKYRMKKCKKYCIYSITIYKKFSILFMNVYFRI